MLVLYNTQREAERHDTRPTACEPVRIPRLGTEEEDDDRGVQEEEEDEEHLEFLSNQVVLDSLTETQLRISCSSFNHCFRRSLWLGD